MDIFCTYRVYYVNRGWWLRINKSTTNEIGDPLVDIVYNEFESSITFRDTANMEKGGVDKEKKPIHYLLLTG